MIDTSTDLDATDNPEIMAFYTQYSSNAENSSKLLSTIHGQFVGHFAKLEGSKLYIESETDIAPKRLPKSGYIYKSLQGDIKRLRRRDEAHKRINSGQAELPNLSILLNDGINAQRAYSDYAPITEEVLRQLTDSAGNRIEFNNAQREAIRIAINTPDIALIQGPPGTGKTTVIRAIVARFEEIFKKCNHGKLPRILITSFQHDAVETAIAKIDTLGLPANHVGGKREDTDKRKAIINKWIESTIQQLNSDIERLTDPELYIEVDALRKRHFAWVENGRDFDKGIEILREYTKSTIYEASSDLQAKISVLLHFQSANKSANEISPEQKEIIALIAKQRTSQAAFLDDGITNLKNLIEELEFWDDDFVRPDFIDVLIHTEGSDAAAFNSFVIFIARLKEKYTTISKADILYGAGDIDWCLSELIAQKEAAILSRIDNINEAKAKVLIEYKQCLYSETEAIVRKYASVQASTCQQTMQLGRGATNEPFDLVIVDEAARANPSDLFIPLCFGRKLILVGDQRQLPHMLDPDTLAELAANTDEETMNFYRTSLFERLFNIFEESDKTNVSLKHTCSLTDQYRMIAEISDFVRDKIYLPKVNLACKTDRRPYSIPEYQNKALVWVNVDKSHGFESRTRSKFRDGETEQAISHLKKLLSSNHDLSSIGIITFYAEQREKIIRHMESIGLTSEERDKIEIGTVDAFQGKEFDAVLFSCSRCNDIPVENIQQKVGFLNDENRLCVALSRGRNLIIGFGDEETVECVKILGDYVEECRSEKGCFINA